LLVISATCLAILVGEAVGCDEGCDEGLLGDAVG
jgi:hypothetical protein